MAAPAGIPEVVAASADDIHLAESEAVSAACDDVVEAEGVGVDAGLRAGRGAPPPVQPAAVQEVNQAVATTTADPQHADAQATPHPLGDPPDAHDDVSETHDDAPDNPYLVHDDGAGSDAAHDGASDGSDVPE